MIYLKKKKSRVLRAGRSWGVRQIEREKQQKKQKQKQKKQTVVDWDG